MPAFFASSSNCGEGSIVTIKIGDSGCCIDRFFPASKPLIPGNRKSMTVRLGACFSIPQSRAAHLQPRLPLSNRVVFRARPAIALASSGCLQLEKCEPHAAFPFQQDSVGAAYCAAFQSPYLKKVIPRAAD